MRGDVCGRVHGGKELFGIMAHLLMGPGCVESAAKFCPGRPIRFQFGTILGHSGWQEMAFWGVGQREEQK